MPKLSEVLAEKAAKQQAEAVELERQACERRETKTAIVRKTMEMIQSHLEGYEVTVSAPANPSGTVISVTIPMRRRTYDQDQNIECIGVMWKTERTRFDGYTFDDERIRVTIYPANRMANEVPVTLEPNQFVEDLANYLLRKYYV